MTRSNTPTNPSEPEMGRLDQLIDAIVNGSAQHSEWDEFRAMAGASAEPWRRLAEEQRLMQTLECGFDAEVRDALAVELPARQAISSHAPSWSIASWRPALGWAAALVMGMAWIGSILIPPSPASAPATDALLAQYMDQPYVIGELPIEIRDVSQTKSGEFVTYVRQIVERRPVNLYNLQLDENSNPVLRETNSEPVMLASRY